MTAGTAAVLMVALTTAAGAQQASPPTADTAAKALADTAPKVTFGGFVDTYYAYDFDRPPTVDRSFIGGALFTTQPARHNEFNVNLAFLEAKLDAPRTRGRLAVQFGTSVQSNYAAEPRVGQVSGPSVEQYLQEATAGYRVAKALWVDAGIFFANVGMESFISRDNPTYTRSLAAEYSPYYSAGVKFTLAATSKLTARLDVVNGWQNISENNSGKGAGLRLDYAPDANSTLSYYNLFSDEAGNRLRTFNGVGAKVTRGALTLLGEADVGTQRRGGGAAGSSSWYGLFVIARAQVAPAVALAGRVERYADPDQVIVNTGARPLANPLGVDAAPGATVANPALRANAASLGVDVSPVSRVLWRTEVRGFANRDAVFPNGRRPDPRTGDGFVVTSLALTF